MTSIFLVYYDNGEFYGDHYNDYEEPRKDILMGFHDLTNAELFAKREADKRGFRKITKGYNLNWYYPEPRHLNENIHIERIECGD